MLKTFFTRPSKDFDSAEGEREKKSYTHTFYPIEEIKEKKFTQREIDVLSFIISGRSSKRIANILSISPRTVDNHMRHIMLKLGCHSREKIIEYIERSGSFLKLKNHFLYLNNDENLKKTLLEIKSHQKEKVHECLIVFDEEGKDLSFVPVLQKYLTIAGIKLYFKHSYESEQDPPFPQKFDSVLYIVYKNTKDVTHIKPCMFSSSKLIFLNIEEKEGSHTQEDHSKTVHVTFNKNNINITLVTLLQHMLQEGTIDKIVRNFKTFYNFKEIPSESFLLDFISKKNTLFKSIKILLLEKPFKWLKISVVTGVLGGVFLFALKENNTLKGNSSWGTLYVDSNINPYINHVLLERPRILHAIHTSLKKDPGLKCLALIGAGGAGKTTLARHYAYYGKFSFVWEINAETPESLTKSFEDLLENLCTQEHEIRNLRSLEKIKDRLLKEEKMMIFILKKLKEMGNWLLIFDNVESFKDIQKYFPLKPQEWKNGHIILTTTNTNIKNASEVKRHIFLDELSLEEKITLFNQIVYNQHTNNLSPSESKKLKSFLSSLPSFPLDVATAAYYIKITNISLDEYSDYLRNAHSELSKMQTDLLKDTSNYTKTRFGIITLSLKKIIRENASFSNLLLFISLLASQKIPKKLLDCYKGGVITDSFIYHLKKYSLITDDVFDIPNSHFSIHRNTQDIIFKYIINNMDAKNIEANFKEIEMFMESFILKSLEEEDFLWMRSLVNHCEALQRNAEKWGLSLSPSLKGMLGCMYYYLSHYKKAKTFLEQSLAALDKEPYKDHPVIPILFMYLGNAYRSLQDYDKAKDMLTHSLLLYKKTPENYRGTARSLGYLGIVYRNLKDFQRAKTLLEKSLLIHEQKNTHTIGHAWILAHLGNTYMILGEYDKARPLLEKSLLIYQKSSEDYVGAAWVMGSLGNVHRELKNYVKAQELLEKSLSICKKHFDDHHLYIASALRYLGVLYLDLKKTSIAKDFFNKSLNIYKENPEKNLSEIAKTLHYLGKSFFLEGDLAQAETFNLRALGIYNQNSHCEHFMPYENLSEIYLRRGNNSHCSQEYEKWMLKTKETLKKSLDTIDKHYPLNSSHALRIKKMIERLHTLQATKQEDPV